MRLVFSNLHFPFLSVIFLLIPHLTRLPSTQVTYHLTSLIFVVQRPAYTRSGFAPFSCFPFTGFYQFLFLQPHFERSGSRSYHLSLHAYCYQVQSGFTFCTLIPT